MPRRVCVQATARSWTTFSIGFVGAMIGGFEAAVGLVLGIWTVVETAVGERPTQPFMEEQEEKRDLEGSAAGQSHAATIAPATIRAAGASTVGTSLAAGPSQHARG